MKNVPCLAVSLLLSTAFFAAAKDDDSTPPPPTTAEILSLQDPDGIPLVISHPVPKPPSQAEIDAEKQEDAKAAANKDWLLRSYEDQLHKRSPGDGDNLYYRIASDKGLSNLAGVSALSPATGAPVASLPVNNDKDTLGQRPDLSFPSGINSSSGSTSIFKPLITPLGAADAAGLHNFYSIQSSTTTTPVPPPKATDTSRISPDLDMPGEVAAKNNPLTKDSLTFDTLPDDVLPDKASASPRAHIAEDALPLSTNAAQIQKINDTALTAPGSIKVVTPSNTAALERQYEEDFAPRKLTAPSPVRQPIQSPYSYLDR